MEKIILPIKYLSDEQKAILADIPSAEKDAIKDIISKIIAGTYLDDIKETFMNQGPGLYGKPWEPLSAMRIAQRGTDWPILIDTGTLMESFYIIQKQLGQYVVKTDNLYARRNEFGGFNEQGFYVPERSYIRSTLIKNEDKYKKLAEELTEKLLS